MANVNPCGGFFGACANPLLIAVTATPQATEWQNARRVSGGFMSFHEVLRTQKPMNCDRLKRSS